MILPLLKQIPRHLRAAGVSQHIIDRATEEALYLYGRFYKSRIPSGRFLILMQGRSGSSLLCDLLDSHPQVRCQSELLENPLRSPLRFLESLAAYSGKYYEAWGFKAKLDQLDSQPQLPVPRRFLEKLALTCPPRLVTQHESPGC